eukprot:13984399-Alexandrium_andersonii.AAC.1
MSKGNQDSIHNADDEREWVSMLNNIIHATRTTTARDAGPPTRAPPTRAPPTRAPPTRAPPARTNKSAVSQSA